MRLLRQWAALALAAALGVGVVASGGRAQSKGGPPAQSHVSQPAKFPSQPEKALPEPIAVLGEVKRPCLVPYSDGITAAAAIEASGGLSEHADGESLVLRRLGSPLGTLNGVRALAGDPLQNVALKAGDTLVVPHKAAPAAAGRDPAPEQGQSVATSGSAPAGLAAAPSPASQATGAPQSVDPSTRVAIVGMVAKPGTFYYQPVMVREALKAAGGLSKEADARKIVIRRAYLIDPLTSRSVVYDHDKVAQGKSPDVTLLPGDVIDVPKRGKKTFLSSVGGAIGKVGSFLAAVARPLIAGTSPAAGAAMGALSAGGRQGDAGGSAAYAVMTGGRAPTALETALLRSIAVEQPEVRDRIYNQARLFLAARER